MQCQPDSGDVMIEKEELSSIIPHRDRMLLLGRVVDYNLEEMNVEAEYRITEDCILFDPAAKGVPAWAGFELMAQAFCALCGIRDKKMGVPSKNGVILAVSQLQTGLPFFGAGSILCIKVKETERMDSVCFLEGEISLDGQRVLEGKLTVMEVDSDDQNRLN